MPNFPSSVFQVKNSATLQEMDSRPLKFYRCRVFKNFLEEVFYITLTAFSFLGYKICKFYHVKPCKYYHVYIIQSFKKLTMMESGALFLVKLYYYSYSFIIAAVE